jgi:hypothetical protein
VGRHCHSIPGNRYAHEHWSLDQPARSRIDRCWGAGGNRYDMNRPNPGGGDLQGRMVSGIFTEIAARSGPARPSRPSRRPCPPIPFWPTVANAPGGSLSLPPALGSGVLRADGREGRLSRLGSHSAARGSLESGRDDDAAVKRFMAAVAMPAETLGWLATVGGGRCGMGWQKAWSRADNSGSAAMKPSRRSVVKSSVSATKPWVLLLSACRIVRS